MSTIETFGLSPSADIQGKIDVNTVSGLRIHIGKVHYYCPQLFGEFNAYNLIAAIGMAMRIGLSSKVIEKGLLTFAGVPGRLQIYSLPNGSFACIDKAHNPSSFKAILGTLRLMTDHLIVVFGAGGERDKSKRPLMGQIATQFCDVVIITSDDPRSENPQQIIEDIFIGIDQQFQSKVFKEIDRELAIKKAYNYSRKGSMIALLGKGPEEYQLINGTKYYFSEREILKSL
jgi:UDP-N-acetylmuramoyl-L-alanyl-D-glutamate--2,6-diaminopimelate ligase